MGEMADVFLDEIMNYDELHLRYDTFEEAYFNGVADELYDESCARYPSAFSNVKKKIKSCPKCSSEMIIRTNSQTGQQFLGCSKFPECKGSRNI